MSGFQFVYESSPNLRGEFDFLVIHYVFKDDKVPKHKLKH